MTPTVKTVLVTTVGVCLAVAGVLDKPVGILVVVAVLATMLVTSTLRRPLNGILLSLVIFPIYPLVRSWATLNLPVALIGIKFWPDILIALTYLGIVVHAIRKKVRLRFYGDDWPALLWLSLVLYGSAITAVSQHPFVLLFAWHYAALPILGYFAVRFLRPDARASELVVRVLLVSYVCLSLLSIADFVLKPEYTARLADAARPEVAKYAMGVDSKIVNTIEYWKSYARMQSLLFQENVFGSLSAFISLYCLAWFTLTRRAVVRFGPLFGLATLSLLLSVSRGSVVAWIVGVGVLLILQRRYSWRLTIAAVAIVLLCGAALLYLADNPRVQVWVNMVAQTGIYDGKLGQDRAHQWWAAWDLFVRNPSGTGIGTVGEAASRSGFGTTIVADGNYFAILGELGIPGVVGLAFHLGGLFWVLGRWQRTTNDPALKALGMALAAYLCGCCVNALSANIFEYYYTWPVFWFLVAIYLNRCEAGGTMQH